ncbi:flavodoxin family protein [Candidatus Methanoprimaticola sp. MG2]|uniref:flavodoxin family protein n=1 Tax=Candidatus Methanoprimaticola sp. MG2 TaxID=3228838 RepID=UPI0039C63DC0
MSEVTAIIASPRKNGNGATIVGKMVETLEAAGKKVNVFYLNQLENVKGCQACMGCKKAGKCVRKDDLTPVLESIAESESVILSTPDYFGLACAQYRTLEDRFYGYVGMKDGNFVANIPEGKKVAVVVTSGSGAGADNIEKGIGGVMSGFLKCEIVGSINYKEGPSGPAKDNAEVLAEAAALAGKL